MKNRCIGEQIADDALGGCREPHQVEFPANCRVLDHRRNQIVAVLLIFGIVTGVSRDIAGCLLEYPPQEWIATVVEASTAGDTFARLFDFL